MLNDYSQFLAKANLAFLLLTAEAILHQVPAASCSCFMTDDDEATLVVYLDPDAPLTVTLHPRDENSIALWVRGAGDDLSISVRHLPFSPQEIAADILRHLPQIAPEQTFSEALDQATIDAYVKFFKGVAQHLHRDFHDAQVTIEVLPLGTLRCRRSSSFGNFCIEFRFESLDQLHLNLGVIGDPSSYKVTSIPLQPYHSSPSTVAKVIANVLTAAIRNQTAPNPYAVR
jgi:hypothetical protein